MARPGPGEGREAPGPAVRGQQRAALGLREKLTGCGLLRGCGAASLGKPGVPGGEQLGGKGGVGVAHGKGRPWG